MEKLLKNIHLVIVLWTAYNLYTIYEEYDPKPEEARQQTERLRLKLAKNKKVKKEIDDFYKNIDEAKLKIQKVKESVEKTQQLLPTEISDLENMTLLRQVAEDLNIKSMKIIPGKEEAKGFFISKQYKFTGQATYVQFVVFFERISNNKRMLNIKDLNLAKAGEQRGKFQMLQGSFILEAYKHNPNYKEPESAPEAASKAGGAS